MGKKLVVTPDPSSELAARDVFRAYPGMTGVIVCCCLEDFTAGPLTNTLSPEALLRHRYRRWWRKMAGGNQRLSASALTHMECADTLELWSGGTAREQLGLLAMVHAAACQGKTFEQVAFRQFEAPNLWDALAVMSRERLQNAPSPSSCSSDLFNSLLRIWQAVSAPEPSDLFALCREWKPISGLPYLSRGLRSLLDCYPDQASGLDSKDRLLLEETGVNWTSAARIVAPIMAGQRGGQVSGDGVLFRRLWEMADPGLSEPALLFRGDPKRFFTGEFRLTTAGADFLAKRRNAVKVNGIDRWIAGVHLDSRAGNVWFRGANGPTCYE